ncbi:MAG TPA: methyltransferase domain-containing protein [Vicinamibacterales bacterium]|nr:methyltransferase domain-containing protein [Vicinamibacterales bacterium]
MIEASAAALETRARQSRGASEPIIHRVVGTALRARHASGVLADIGCGAGDLWHEVEGMFSRCVGVDAVRYAGLPPAVELHHANLDVVPLPLSDGSADVVAAIETIEHLENPWSFCRELARIVRPGGWVVITTPNQHSVLSLFTLAVKQRFPAFQDAAYPAHRTALLEIDLRRMAAECGLVDLDVHYTESGRVPLMSAHYPSPLSHMFPRALSDNLMLIGRRRA